MDVDAVATDDAEYRALAFREPDLGVSGVRRYLQANFGVEDDVECWFGTSVASSDCAGQSSGGRHGSRTGSA
jgi:hypothetical protein